MALFMNIGIFVHGGQKHTTFLLQEISIGIPGLSKIYAATSGQKPEQQWSKTASPPTPPDTATVKQVPVPNYMEIFASIFKHILNT